MTFSEPSTPLPSTNSLLNSLKSCIHCGFCLPVCPTYKVTGSEVESPRGRLYLLKHMLQDAKNESDEPNEHLQPKQIEPHLSQCLGCLACETACPSGVPYGDILHQSQKMFLTQKNPFIRHLKRFFFQTVLPNSNLLQFGAFWLRLYQKAGLQRLVRFSNVLSLLPLIQHYEALIPPIPQHKPFNIGMSFGNPEHERVALFTGCIMDVMYNSVHWATIKALVNNGYYVTLPEQTCCGALAYHGGEDDIAKKLARKNVLSILRSQPDWVITNSAGCGSTLKDYTKLLANDGIYAEKSRLFSEKTVDIMALLAKKPLKPCRLPIPQTVAYHAACHLHHAQGIINEPENVLHQIEGLTLLPLKDAAFCCGSAGIYNLEHPELSNDILAEKIRHIEATQAQTLVTGNPGCLLQITKGLQENANPMRIAHPIELVAESYSK